MLAIGLYLREDEIEILWLRDATAAQQLQGLGFEPALLSEEKSADRQRAQIVRSQGRPEEGFGWQTVQVLNQQIGSDLPANVQREIASSIDEIALNAATHADSPIGFVRVGAAFPHSHLIEVCVLDLGITIRSHLGRVMTGIEDDVAAIREAIKDGTTGTVGRNRWNEPNSGVGLHYVHDFLTQTKGALAILSGNAVVRFDRDEKTQFIAGPHSEALLSTCDSTRT